MLNLNRREFLEVAASASLVLAGPASAQQFPSKPIRIIVPTSTGTSADTTARFFGDALSQRLGVPVVVENRSGAGGLIAYTSLAKAPPDGYTLLLAGLPLHLLPLFSEVPNAFDPVKDFTPVTRVLRAPLAIVVEAGSPYRSLGDLLQALRAPANALTYSSGGVGSSAHLCAVMLNSSNKSAANHIPYKDTSAAVLDVAGGRVNFTCQGSSSVLPLIQGGRLRALAVTSLKHWDTLPDVPTAADSGLPGFELWPGLDFIGPAGVPDAVVKTLSDAFMEIGQSQQFKAYCQKQALSHELMGYRALRDTVPKEAASWRRIAAIAKS